MEHLPRFLTLALICLLLACDRQSAPPADADEVQTYRVRGKVVSVEDRTVNIHHEAIPQFVHITGKADGMDEMVMAFTLGEDVEADSLGPGDRISFDLHARWKPSAEFWIDNLAPLPEDAKLNLTEAPPADAADDAHAGHNHDGHDHAGHTH